MVVIDMNEPKDIIRALHSSYRTKENQLVNDFFKPCLEFCSGYQRAAGYFSSTALNTWCGLLERLGEHDLRIELIISPELQRDDIEAMRNAVDLESKQHYLTMAGERLISDYISNTNNTKLRLDLFSWLIANDRLRIKFAHPIHQSDSDLFHQKTGVFYFPWGDIVAFEGSANESYSGHMRNWEKIQVFRSWVSEDVERLQNTKAEFEEYWKGQEPTLVTVDLSEKSVRKLREIAPIVRPKVKASPPEVPGEDVKDIWLHQDDALNVFLQKRAGILEMATGTGKTKTALKILQRLLESKQVDRAIISTDGNDLLTQWYDEVCTNHVYETGFIKRIFRQFFTYGEGQTYLLHQSASILIISRDNLGKVIKKISAEDGKKTLIIHDEIHGLGSPGMVKNLKNSHSIFNYKLGLSATPEREYDSDGSAFIESEIGPVIFRFGIEDAIKKGILVEFDYVPLPYELSDSDKLRLKNIKAREYARKQEGKPMSKEELWRLLADVYKTAENKPLTFKHYLSEHKDVIKNSIIFAADREYGEKILDVISKVTYNYRTYYAEDDRENLIQFSAGRIDTLITCHKISQGIDIQKLKTVILFSSDRARLETIQRIGRCLRRDKHDPEKRALVIDFCREDADEKSADFDRKNWLTYLSGIKKVSSDGC